MRGKSLQTTVKELLSIIEDMDFSFGRVQSPEIHERLDKAVASAEASLTLHRRKQLAMSRADKRIIADIESRTRVENHVKHAREIEILGYKILAVNATPISDGH